MSDSTPTAGADPVQVARATARAIGGVPSNFMLDAATYVAAAEAGYAGMDFYFAGRAGALGDVDAAAVVSELGVFPEPAVVAAWEATADLESRSAAAQRFADQAARWAGEHLDPDALDYDRLAELARQVLEAADLGDAAMVAGWLELDEPEAAPARALHRINGLRELRFARHRDELGAADVAPLDAVMVASPFMAGIFGWPEPHPEPDEATRQAWSAAEAATDERFARDLEVLTPQELAEFADLCDGLVSAVR